MSSYGETTQLRSLPKIFVSSSQTFVREFTDYERKMNQKEWTDQDQYKRRKLNEDMVKVNFTKNDAKGKIEHGDSGNHSAKSIEVPVSLPHSKSLSNNRSRSSKNEIANDSNAQMTNFP